MPLPCPTARCTPGRAPTWSSHALVPPRSPGGLPGHSREPRVKTSHWTRQLERSWVSRWTTSSPMLRDFTAAKLRGTRPSKKLAVAAAVAPRSCWSIVSVNTYFGRKFPLTFKNSSFTAYFTEFFFLFCQLCSCEQCCLLYYFDKLNAPCAHIQLQIWTWTHI